MARTKIDPIPETRRVASVVHYIYRRTGEGRLVEVMEDDYGTQSLVFDPSGYTSVEAARKAIESRGWWHEWRDFVIVAGVAAVEVPADA